MGHNNTKKNINQKSEKSNKNNNTLNNKKNIYKSLNIISEINFIFISKYENKKILIVVHNNGIIIYDIETYETLGSLIKNNSFHSLIRLKNDIFAVPGNFILTFKLKNINNKYEIIFENLIKNNININNGKIEKLISSKFNEDNIILLYSNNFEIIKLEYLKENDETFIKRKLISIIKAKNIYELLEINKEKLAYVDNNVLSIFSRETNQILQNYKVDISIYCTEIFQMLNDDILCYGGLNSLYFISIKYSIICKQISFESKYKIIGMEKSNENIIYISTRYFFNNHDYYVDMFEINCIYDKFNKNKEKKLMEVNINSKICFNKKTMGNWYIRHIDDQKIITSEQNFIHFWK